MVGGRKEKEGPACYTWQHFSDDRRQQTAQARQTHDGDGAHAISEEGMNANRQVKQCMGNDVSERAQCVKCETTSSRGADLLWSRASILGGSGGAGNITEVMQKGQAATKNSV